MTNSLKNSCDLTIAYDMAEGLSGKYLMRGKLMAAGKSLGAYNPATGEKIGTLANCSGAEVSKAVEDAHSAQKAWALLNPRDRGRLITQCADLLLQHKDELARLMALETGKALRTECLGEAGVFADIYRFYGGLGSEIKGQTLPFNPKMLTMTLREPVGVVGAIIPWNVPLLLMALKVAPALVAGNGVVVKPAEEATLTVLRCAELMNQILPAGILNVVPGVGEQTGQALISHPLIRKVSFTGSVETGKLIARVAADRLIPTTLELGGKSPMIIFPDADLETVVTGAINGMRFTRQGQSCSAASRIFIHESRHDAFVARLKERLNQMVIGDPLDDRTDIGSIISKQQYDKVRSYIDYGMGEKGVESHVCGTLPRDEHLKKGYFLQPVLFTQVTNQSKLAREEIFGPVACIIKWSQVEDVIAQANDTDFGLAATVWTDNLKDALTTAQALQAGLVQVNQNVVVQAGMPYGGYKNSGMGKEATLEALLDHYTKSKTVIVNLG